MQTMSLPTERKNVGISLFSVLFASCLISFSSLFRLDLPFSPVPIVLQNSVILFCSLFFGPKQASLATAIFLLEGFLGLPVFAGGSYGPLAFLGPRGGYFLGYLASSYMTGYVWEKSQKSTSSLVLALLTGNSFIYVFGALGLSRFIGLSKAMYLGVLPFIVVDIFKGYLIGKSFGFLAKKN
jgi:biotin transport system substrate-specific component